MYIGSKDENHIQYVDNWKKKPINAFVSSPKRITPFSLFILFRQQFERHMHLAVLLRRSSCDEELGARWVGALCLLKLS